MKEIAGSGQPPLSGDAPRKHASRDTQRDTLVARARVPSAPLSILPASVKVAQAR